MPHAAFLQAIDDGHELLVGDAPVAGQRDVEVVVRRPVVAGIADELPGLAVEPELELREQESRVAARLDRNERA